MSRKIQLRLLISATMSKKEENNKIRFPRKVREYFEFSNNQVVLGKGQYQIVLQVKQAYKNDVQKLANMLRQNKLSDEEAMSVGFVTRSVQQRFNRRKGNSVWVSDGIGNITIGADPEFGLINNEGDLVRGSNIISHNGQFGSDGPSVEVRPTPSNNHLDVVKNIEHILRNAPEKANDFDWVGGATFTDKHRVYWFGGHIHLGRPAQLTAKQVLPIYHSIATALDGLLAFPLVKIDMPNPQLRRNGCPYNYGKAGDIRVNYPQLDRFEYRVPSGLWMTHPVLAKIVLGTTKAIVETAYNRIADKKFDLEWAGASKSHNSLLRSFNLLALTKTRAIINQSKLEDITTDNINAWEKCIRALDRFEDYSEEIEAFIELVKQKEVKLDLDIRKNWLENSHKLVSRPSAKLRTALEAVEEK